MPDGTCKRCPEYTRAQGDGHTCGADQCNVAVIKALVSPSLSTAARANTGAEKATDGNKRTSAETTGGVGGFWRADFADGE